MVIWVVQTTVGQRQVIIGFTTYFYTTRVGHQGTWIIGCQLHIRVAELGGIACTEVLLALLSIGCAFAYLGHFVVFIYGVVSVGLFNRYWTVFTLYIIAGMVSCLFCYQGLVVGPVVGIDAHVLKVRLLKEDVGGILTTGLSHRLGILTVVVVVLVVLRGTVGEIELACCHVTVGIYHCHPAGGAEIEHVVLDLLHTLCAVCGCLGIGLCCIAALPTDTNSRHHIVGFYPHLIYKEASLRNEAYAC